ncbi:MAG: hypothetical protein ACRCTZ_08220 [Sarcina sp.]
MEDRLKLEEAIRDLKAKLLIFEGRLEEIVEEEKKDKYIGKYARMTYRYGIDARPYYVLIKDIDDFTLIGNFVYSEDLEVCFEEEFDINSYDMEVISEEDMIKEIKYYQNKVLEDAINRIKGE